MSWVQNLVKGSLISPSPFLFDPHSLWYCPKNYSLTSCYFHITSYFQLLLSLPKAPVNTWPSVTSIKQSTFFRYSYWWKPKYLVLSINFYFIHALYETLYGIWYHLYYFKNLRNTHGGVLLSKVEGFNYTKNNTFPWLLLTFFKLYKWYQIPQTIAYSKNIAATIFS